MQHDKYDKAHNQQVDLKLHNAIQIKFYFLLFITNPLIDLKKGALSNMHNPK